MPQADFFTSNLARAFLAGAWSRPALLRRGIQACGGRSGYLFLLLRRVLAAFPRRTPELTEERLTAFLLHQGAVACEGSGPKKFFTVRPNMAPRPGLPEIPGLLALTTTTAVTEWLALRPRQLDWFAECPGRTRKVPDGPLNHYTYRWLEKRTGGKRLLEVPRSRLKSIQRLILHEILDRVPPHECVHGYRRGRSVLGYASVHAGQAFVLRLDLRDFFPSIRASRVFALFASLGYPRAVARVLTRLCTTILPLYVRAQHPQAGVDWNRYESAHLPQGAPTSPALANLCAFRLDCRLAGLARSTGACYTRYADDLAFSGGEELEQCARRFQVMVCRLALEEGFEVNTRKTRFMRQGVRQHLAGIVVNARPNVTREVFDQLKAILTNCVRHGPGEQNRGGVVDFRGHLLGRIAHVAAIHSGRGQRLRELFDRIEWENEP